jgi:PAS domain S-box-containing protein
MITNHDDELPPELVAELLEARSMLSDFASALFPDETPDVKKLTWSDAEARRVRTATETPEERLLAAEARFRTLVEQIPAVTFMAVLGEGKNEVYVSPHIERMLGYTQEEWLDNPFLWYRRLHPDDRPLWNEEFARGCRVGGPFRAECRFLARDGHVVWVLGEARIVKDDRGRPSFLQGVAFDITESKRAQELLLTEAVRRAKVTEELEIARRMQTSLVPRTFAVDGLEIAALMLAADDVGGDYYDVLPVPGGAFIAIGDVSGHGLNAGLVMMMLQSAFAGVVRARNAVTPRDALLFLNDVLFDNVRSRLGQRDHVTLTILRYTVDGRLMFAGAHEDMLVLRAETGLVERVRPRGAWVAARRNIAAVTFNDELHLDDGDLVVLYTDGVTESMSPDGEQFELTRLADLVAECKGSSPADVCAKIAEAAAAFRAGVPPADDVSVLCFRYSRASGRT